MAHRNDREYVRRREALKRQAKATNALCAYCDEPFDFDLEWKHPMSFTANHIEAVANGGSMTGPLEPMHRSCNSRLGAKPRGSIVKKPKPKTSRDW